MSDANKTDLAKQKPAEPKPPITLGVKGLELTDFGALWRFAECVCQSELAPKGVDTPQAVVIAVQMGAELGLPPLAALQNIAVINGRPTVWGDAQLAICRGSGLFDESAFDEHFEGQGDSLAAYCTVRRIPDGRPVTRIFGVKHAKKAGLWPKRGPWQEYPERMMQLRARSYALRDTFTDCLRGCEATEVARDIINVEAAPTAVGVADLITGPTEPVLQEEEATEPQPKPEPVYEGVEPDQRLQEFLDEIAQADSAARITELVLGAEKDPAVNDKPRMANIRAMAEKARAKLAGKGATQPKQKELIE